MSCGSAERVESRFWCVEHFNLADVLTDEDRAALNRHMQHRHYEAGEVIYLPGDPSDAVYTLRSGRVRLGYLGEGGRRLTFSTVEPGQIFGEMALVSSGTRRWIAEAVEETTLCMISKGDLLRFAADHPKLALSLTLLIGDRLVQIENKLEDLLFKGVRARLAETLLDLGERFGGIETQSEAVRLKLTHEELAHLIGSTRETVSATLGEWESQGLIRKGRGSITLLDRAGLSKIR